MQMNKATSQVNKTKRRREKTFQGSVPIGKVGIILAGQLASATRSAALNVNRLKQLSRIFDTSFHPTV